MAIIALLIGLFTGGGGAGLGGLEAGAAPAPGTESTEYIETAEEKDRRELSEIAFASSEEFWIDLFAESGQDYDRATLVFYDAPTRTGCGQGSPAMGPFYCSADSSVYLELGFIDQLQNQFGAAGDFAWAYVVSHEVAHHVQNELGISRNVISESQRSPGRRNELSIRQELQADCFAGAWANQVYTEGDAGNPNGIEIDRSDISEALDAAAAVGDDRIQEQATGRINPEAWTHGSSEQRVEWFTRGFETGNPQECDTFSVTFENL